MTGYIKEPHTTIFTGPTSCGKTDLDSKRIQQTF